MSKQVAKIEDKENKMSVAEMPEFMKGTAQTGLESLDSTDYVMPIIKLMQATDEAVQTGKAVAGDFYHLTAEQNLGKSLIFIPCFVRKRYMLFRPQDDQGNSGSNILARADDGVHWSPPDATFNVKLKGRKEQIQWRTKKTVMESGLAEFGSYDSEDPQSKPAATLIYDIVVLIPEHPELSPAILSLKGSSVKKARNWFTSIKAGRAPIFGLMFKAFGSLEKNGSNMYQAYNIQGNGFVKSEDLYKQGEEINKICATQAFRGDREDEPESVPEDIGKENPNY